MQRPRGERGATLLDAVVGTALMLVVFVGIVGAFQLTIIVVSNNKARAGGIALANERLEYIRSLSYDAIGTVGGIPAGALAQSEVVPLNDISYTRRTFVSYEDDPGDGEGGADSNGVVTDYKAAKVTVSWQARDGEHAVTLITRVSPPTGVESSVPGGTLSINVRDALSQPVLNAQVRIINDTTDPTIDTTTYTNATGYATVLGVPAGADYSVIATKPGYSNAQTYSANATNTNPNPANLGVALDTTTAATFEIDLLSTKTVETYTAVTRSTTTDPFSDDSRVASSTNITISTGEAHLSGVSGSYPDTGMLISTAVSTTSLAQWNTLSWIDDEPSGTEIRYRIYDVTGTSLIPDAYVPGNSAGLTVSPVDLTNIATSTYLSLTIHATLLSSDPLVTPSIESWSVSNDSGPVPFSNVSFTLRGAKTIGTGPGGTVYKYDDQSLSSGPSARVTLEDMEYDTYTLDVLPTSGYTVSSSCAPQPEVLAPNTTQTTRLYLSPLTTNSLLVDVTSASGDAITDASVRVYRASPAYDTTIESDGCGQSFFSELSAGTVGTSNAYSISVSAPGYQPYAADDVNVSGVSRRSVILNN